MNLASIMILYFISEYFTWSFSWEGDKILGKAKESVISITDIDDLSSFFFSSIGEGNKSLVK